MKMITQLFLFLIVFVQAEVGHADILAYSIAPCSFWMSGGGNGFVCTNFPPTIHVPQAESVASTIRTQNARIADLEKRIAELEKLCHQ